MTISANNFWPQDLPDIQTGDAIFVKGKKGCLDWFIRKLTGSAFVHAAILIELNGLWFVVETRQTKQYGYQLVPIEWWLTRHQSEQVFYCSMPTRNSIITKKIKRILMNSEESLRPYRISWIVLTYILQTWFRFYKPNLSKLYKGLKPLICSTLVQEAWERAGAIEPNKHMTPADLVEYIGGESKLLPIISQLQNSQTDVSNKNSLLNRPTNHPTLETNLS